MFYKIVLGRFLSAKRAERLVSAAFAQAKQLNTGGMAKNE